MVFVWRAGGSGGSYLSEELVARSHCVAALTQHKLFFGLEPPVAAGTSRIDGTARLSRDRRSRPVPTRRPHGKHTISTFGRGM